MDCQIPVLIIQVAVSKNRIAALLHTHNHERVLGRALDSLRPCDEVLVVDHDSTDDTVKIAREHGARVIQGVNGVDHGAYAQDAGADWLLCILPTETLTDSAEAALHEWKDESLPEEQPPIGFAFSIREQSAGMWKDLPAEVRLVNRTRINWTGDLPPQIPGSPRVHGEILRIPAE